MHWDYLLKKLIFFYFLFLTMPVQKSVRYHNQHSLLFIILHIRFDVKTSTNVSLSVELVAMKQRCAYQWPNVCIW
jgi:hypothetical protein